MSWELWQNIKFTFSFLFSVVFKTAQICLIFLGPFSNLVLCFHSNRKRNVYQSWEISYQSDRPCVPENAPPPPIRTTAHLPFPLLWTIPNLSSRHQDTPSLLLTTTPSLPRFPTPPPCTSPTARSTATTVTLDDCSSSTSESRDAGGTGTKCKRGDVKWKAGRKIVFHSFPHPARQTTFDFLCLFLLFPTLAVIHGTLYTGSMIIWFWLHHLMCHHFWKPHMLRTISQFKWVTLSWF